jgi:hypothetical protein
MAGPDDVPDFNPYALVSRGTAGCLFTDLVAVS